MNILMIKVVCESGQWQCPGVTGVCIPTDKVRTWKDAGGREGGIATKKPSFSRNLFPETCCKCKKKYDKGYKYKVYTVP